MLRGITYIQNLEKSYPQKQKVEELWWPGAAGMGNMRRCRSKGTNFSYKMKLGAGYLMCSLMTIVNTTVLYT